jgi:ribosomal protein S18 acetylase RimI-like enzyme
MIRPYVNEDAAALAGLLSTLGYPATRDDVVGRMAALSDSHHTLVAVAGEKVAGFIGIVSLPVYEHPDPIGYILALSVSPAYQGQGIGKALLRAAEDWFRREGVKDIRVSSGLQREEAHRFYEQSGYAKTGYRFRKLLAEEF